MEWWPSSPDHLVQLVGEYILPLLDESWSLQVLDGASKTLWAVPMLTIRPSLTLTLAVAPPVILVTIDGSEAMLRNRRSSILAVNDPLTLRILLDHEEKATGKLYLDDGHSYEYQNGFFIRASISYENHVLQYALENTDSQLSPAFNIERVVVEGLRRVPHAVIASTSGPAQSLDFESTNARTVVIRKPDLPVDRFWSVSLSFSE